jgi:dGTPase
VSIQPRIQQERFEREFLSDRAAKSYASRGRERPIAPCDIRTEFQRDRDRIIHSNSFRRLKHKTQMFLSPSGDHYRTRLTHTMEVSQIARTISRALRLNEDLTEAIALGHDLGHTPFGHSGERALDTMLRETGGFRHYEQSGRVVRYLENYGEGLNLTAEVIDGIEHHTGDVWPMTLEGCVVRLSDRIAYLNHDIQDAIGAGVLQAEELPQECLEILGRTHGVRIDTMIRDCIVTSMNTDTITMSEPIRKSTEQLRAFMFSHVYNNTSDLQMDGRVHHVMENLYVYFLAHPQLLPRSYAVQRERFGDSQAVVDYIAGMTDRFAVAQFERLFVPAPRN